MTTKNKIVFILLFIFISGYAAADLPVMQTGADIDYAPFSFYQNNVPAGFDIQFFYLLAERMDRKPVYFLNKWHKILDRARSGELDVILGAVYSQEREEYLHFSVPYNTIKLALVVPKESNLQYPEDLWNKEMAVLENDVVPWIFLERNSIPVSAASYPTMSEALRHLKSGAHDFAIIPEPYIDRYKNRREFRGLRIANDNLSTLTYRIGLTEDNKELLHEMNMHIRSLINSKKYEILRERWLFSGEGTGTADRNLHKWPVLLLSIISGLLLIGFFLFHFAVRKNYTTSL